MATSFVLAGTSLYSMDKNVNPAQVMTLKLHEAPNKRGLPAFYRLINLLRGPTTVKNLLILIASATFNILLLYSRQTVLT